MTCNFGARLDFSINPTDLDKLPSSIINNPDIMKLSLTSYFLFLLFFVSGKLYSQDKFGQGDFSVNPYIGIIPLDIAAKVGETYVPTDAKLVGIPVSLGIKGEFMLHPFLGFKIDMNWVYIGYKYTRNSENLHWNSDTGGYTSTIVTENYERTSRKIRVMLGINHYLRRSKRFHAYSTIEIGYKNILRRQVTNSVVSTPTVFITFGNYGFPITMRVGLGQKWFLTENLALTTELGLGGTPLHVGMEINF
ncbi:MAG: hypothetical protein ACI8ZM_004410 [Crocinitomix sp.]|jgi:hypothetical protein